MLRILFVSGLRATAGIIQLRLGNPAQNTNQENNAAVPGLSCQTGGMATVYPLRMQRMFPKYMLFFAHVMIICTAYFIFPLFLIIANFRKSFFFKFKSRFKNAQLLYVIDYINNINLSM